MFALSMIYAAGALAIMLALMVGYIVGAGRRAAAAPIAGDARTLHEGERLMPAPAAGAASKRPLAVLHVQMHPSGVRADVECDLPLLVDLAQGLGYQLTPLPSRGLH